jgi:phage replication O-like protein O
MTATIVEDTIVGMTGSSVPIDAYVIDILQRDLLAHDRTPSSFVVYLHLFRRTHGARKESIRMSHQMLAETTGLSKSAVQGAIRNLVRRRLLKVERASPTAVPVYRALCPWRR